MLRLMVHFTPWDSLQVAGIIMKRRRRNLGTIYSSVE